jgi:hypothetical protein
MSKQRIAKVIGGSVVAGALFIVSLSGAAHADEGGLKLTSASAQQADVDGRDFLVWQRNGSTQAGDFDMGGDVDGRDFLVWRR